MTLPRFKVFTRYKRYWIRFSFEGRLRRFVAGDTEHDAHLLIHKVQEAILNGVFDGSRLSVDLPVPAKAKRYTLDDLLDDWRDHQQANDRDMRNVDCMLRQIRRQFEDRLDVDADDIQPDEVTRWIESFYMKGQAPAGNRRRAALNAAYNHAISAGRAKRSPVVVKPKREREDRGQPLDEDQRTRILAHLPVWVADAAVFSWETGARRGELGVLPWYCVDLGAGKVTFENTKNGKDRDVPLTSAAVAVIERQRGRSEDWVFCRDDGRPLDLSELSKGFAAAAKAAKIFRRSRVGKTHQFKLEHARFHDCRHTYGMRLASAGVPLPRIRDLMGHSSIKVTERYAKYIPRTDHDVLTALEGKSCTGSFTGNAGHAETLREQAQTA